MRQYKLTSDIIIETVNTGSAWVHKGNGIRVTHIPTRMVFECTEHASSHKNARECHSALEEWLKTQEYLELNEER